jgi:hypothetical protein
MSRQTELAALAILVLVLHFLKEKPAEPQVSSRVMFLLKPNISSGVGVKAQLGPKLSHQSWWSKADTLTTTRAGSWKLIVCHAMGPKNKQSTDLPVR